MNKGISWRQGLAIALGVPMLILPSIGYFTSYLWSFSIFVWILSVIQGFFQNYSYGEMAVKFPKASGLPGYAQAIYGKNKKNSKLGKFIGGFSAWSYWFAWSPVLAIFSLLIGTYLKGLVPALSSFSEYQLSLCSGIVIFSLLIVINYKGVASGAKLGNILAVISLLPLIVITVAPFVTGDFDFNLINSTWFPDNWEWNISNVLVVLGVFAMAQWSACAWETAVIYGPHYREPGKDIPKALFSCGIICIITFSLVQTSCIGTLGIEGIAAEPYSPLLLIARQTFGEVGSVVTVIMLMAAMILIIQTAFLGSSQAMQSMAAEGNLPPLFGKCNKYGTPIVSMIIISILGLVLISFKTPSAIISASSMGYVFANGISLFGHFKLKREEQKNSHTQADFKTPKFWGKVSLCFSILNLPLYFIGLMYLNSLSYGWKASLFGLAILLFYYPLWKISNYKEKGTATLDVKLETMIR